LLTLTGVPAIGIALVAAPESGAQAGPVVAEFTDVGTDTWTVPGDASCVTIEASGAGGGTGEDFGGIDSPDAAEPEGAGISAGGDPGGGGVATATFHLTPGASLQVNVGGAGADGDDGGAGGSNGGGDGGGGKGSDGAGGGGASDVRLGGTGLGDRILVGGGGGGGGAGGPADDDTKLAPEVDAQYAVPEGLFDEPGGDGGGGGGLTGGAGGDGFLTGVTGGTGGGGGAQGAGGTGGDNSGGGAAPTAGTTGDGGDGGSNGDGGGGAGGGWFGGGGGGAGLGGTGAGGGGGSGFGPADASYLPGVKLGDGAVVITYTPGDTSCVDVLPDDDTPPDVAPDVVEGNPTFTG
jgi:hypothetical protein